MNEPDATVLLGAGGSIPAGVPGMAGMAREFKEDLPRKGAAAKGYSALRQYGASDDVEELLQLANEIIDFRSRPISNFVDSAIKGRKRKQNLASYRRSRTTTRKKIQNFRGQLLEWITQTCLRFDRARAQIIYADLVKIWCDNEIPVFTTNYDGVIEYVATEEGLEISDNFKPDEAREFWDDSLQSFDRAGLQLVKLHGSVYWHANPDDVIEKLDPPSRYNREGQPLERLLIVPTRFKDIYQQNYFPMYTRFLQALGSSRVLLVIGHSMRDEYLLAAVRDRLRDPEFRLIVVDPGSPGMDQLYRVAASETQIIHLQGGIERFHPLIQQALADVGVDRASAHLRDVAELVRRGAKERIEIVDFESWIPAGETESFWVEVKTIVGGSRLVVGIEKDKDPDEFIDLQSSLGNDWNQDPSVIGKHEVEVPVSFSVPSSIGLGPHQLYAGLHDPSGKAIVEDRYGFRISGL